MKQQINPSIKAHLLRSALILLSLLAICAMPFALAQRNTAKPSVTQAATQLAPAAHIPPGAPASAFGLSVPKVANAPFRHHTGVGGDPLVIGNNPLLTYVIDDGTAENAIGLAAGGSFVALNSFPVTGGNNIITSISIAWGTPAFPDPSLNGLPYFAVLWSDPNGDGSPTDAVVLATAPGVISQQGTNTFLTSVIPPTLVTTPNFFVGFVITNLAGQTPAALDTTAPTFFNRSWLANTGNISDLSGAFPVEQTGVVGNFLIRADGEGGVTPTPTATPTATPSPTATECPRATPGTCVSYEAESDDNTLAGSAFILSCPTCSDGFKVGYVGNNSGTLQFNAVGVVVPGPHTLTICYLNGDAVRYALLSVNGGSGMPVSFPSTGSFQTVGSIQTTVVLNTGCNTLEFYNPIVGSWAPDFDRIQFNCPTCTVSTPTPRPTPTPTPAPSATCSQLQQRLNRLERRQRRLQRLHRENPRLNRRIRRLQDQLQVQHCV